MSSFDFIGQVYSEWLGEGLVRADIKAVDEPLWAKLANDIKARRRSGLPDLPKNLDLPTLAESNLESVSPEDRAKLEAVREYQREKKARWRAKKQVVSQGAIGPLYLREEFKAHAEANQWQDRREQGYSWRADIFDFLRDKYAVWLSEGLTQADIKKVDPKGYKALRNRLDVAKDSFPDDFSIPTSWDATLAACQTDEERFELEAARSYHRKRKERGGLCAPQTRETESSHQDQPGP